MQIFQPILMNLFAPENIHKSYEVDASRVEPTENVDENRQNLLQLTQVILESIVNSTKLFPLHMRNVCQCLYQVVSQRFPQAGFQAVGTVIFLRFINPVLVSPHEYGIIELEPTSKMKRGLTLMCKILQNIANNLVFTKEVHMKYFNDFLRSNLDFATDFVVDISSIDLDIASEPFYTQYSNNVNFISDDIISLHRLLW